MAFRLPFLKNNRQVNDRLLTTENLPKHVAIIMDGNGRWAKKRGLPRVAGHKEGMKTVKKIVRKAVELQIEALTLYAFSTENWKRPKPEVETIMKLPNEFLSTYLPELMENNVRVQTIGYTEALPQHTRNAIHIAMEKTANNTGLILNFAINYGSRAEIVEAVKQIATDVKQNKIMIDDIDEDCISEHLFTRKISDPDLLIRTSGEVRLSNFLLWQNAYSEFYFTDVLWPDFNEEEFEKSLAVYQNRKRRYGGI
ncbi:isoprenyl transferase [Salirhabdus sp. Marseille-P4669]|uniref:isoprenyl transferase n=1 Tax=Salirhabdus sp. Marseille-P4669 TaxID=2042310 RepID=UPI000C7BCCDD|nr:isoprenyl transferase [Salirhabdus sp. Marseille-P4669]